jgi:glycosyltransferase involved in cell wall biosynthesis
MAAGRPVVATRVGGLPDLVSDGKTGRLVPPGDVRALSIAVLELIRDRGFARAIGETARGQVRERFAAERLIADVQGLYGELLAAKGLTA